MAVLVCFALKEEASAFRKIAAGRSGVFIHIVGIGRRNAEKSIRDFLAAGSPRVDLVLTCGFAGGLDSNLKVGDVLFEIPEQKSTLSESKPQVSSGSVAPSLEPKLLTAGARPAKFFCADRVAVTVAEKDKLRAETGADAVEMESAAIHDVCRERGIPSVTVRAISDTADEDLPLDFNALSKPDKNLDYGKLAWAIARSPGKIGALLQLQKKTNQAAHQLAAVLEKLILSGTV
jgi:adenosylhomocysteine nucleosidase